MHCQTGQTLLHCASALGQLEIVIYLLNQRSCNVNEQDEVSVYIYTYGSKKKQGGSRQLADLGASPQTI